MFNITSLFDVTKRVDNYVTVGIVRYGQYGLHFINMVVYSLINLLKIHNCHQMHQYTLF